MKTFETVSKNFFQHVASGDVFAVKVRWDGHILGAAGPLSPDALKDPDDYTYTDQLNDFLQERRDKLILTEPRTCSDMLSSPTSDGHP